MYALFSQLLAEELSAKKRSIVNPIDKKGSQNESLKDKARVYNKSPIKDWATEKISNRNPKELSLAEKPKKGTQSNNAQDKSRVEIPGFVLEANKISPKFFKDTKTKIFTVNSLDSQMIFFAKTKYAKVGTSSGDAKVERSECNSFCGTEEPLSAKGEGKLLPTQATSVCTKKKEFT